MCTINTQMKPNIKGFKAANLLNLTLTNDAARFHSVLINLHKVVSQVAQLWFHALKCSGILAS